MPAPALAVTMEDTLDTESKVYEYDSDVKVPTAISW